MASPARSSGIDPRAISLFRKQRHLQALTEDDFRDLVLRPLLLRKGFQDGRDTCGPTEQGKDCYFITHDKFDIRLIYAVQTKRGHITMSRKAKDNANEAVTQLRTALEAPIVLLRAYPKTSSMADR